MGALAVWPWVIGTAGAVAHQAQSIVLSAGAAIPGYQGDSRLTNYLLEHAHQALCGRHPLLSPGMFHPVGHTLVYGDSHFGTIAIYSVLRLLGASIEGAFQGWIVTIAGLNTVALLALMRQLRVHPLVGIALAFLGTSSSAFVFKMGHPQVLPLFPFVLALLCLVKVLQTRDARHLGWACVCWAYQHACYLYYGYLGTIVLLVCVLAYLASFPDRRLIAAIAASARESRRFLLTCVLISTAMVVAIYAPYVRYAALVGTNPIEELIALAPGPRSWFAASPDSLFYSWLSLYDTGVSHPYEKTFFAGGLVWVLTPLMLLRRLGRSQPLAVRVCFTLSVTWLLCAAAITTWSGTTGSMYLAAARVVEPVRAFRAFGRMAYLLIVLQAVAVALFLDQVRRGQRAHRRRLAVLLVAVATAVETLAVRQASYDKSTTQARTRSVAEMWEAAGGKPILAFAPGYSNQPSKEVHLDAWGAALLRGGRSVNGYAGHAPASHAAFLQLPTPENARQLLAQLGIPAKRVSLVTDWSPEAKQALGIRTFDLRGRITPLTTVARLVLAPHETTEIPVTVRSAEAFEVESGQLGLYVSYRLYDDRGRAVREPASLRTALPRIGPNEERRVALRVQAPSAPGRYWMELSMVHERVAWWADLGEPGSRLKLIVRASPRRPPPGRHSPAPPPLPAAAWSRCTSTLAGEGPHPPSRESRSCPRRC